MRQRQGDNSDKGKNMDNSHVNYAINIYLVYSPLKNITKRFCRSLLKSAVHSQP